MYRVCRVLNGVINIFREILELKKKLQDNKQLLVVERERINGDESVESFRPGEVSAILSGSGGGSIE